MNTLRIMKKIKDLYKYNKYKYIYIYIFKKKTKDRLIQDYKSISILYFQFLVWTKNTKKKNSDRTSSDPMDN